MLGLMSQWWPIVGAASDRGPAVADSSDGAGYGSAGGRWCCFGCIYG